MGRSTLSNQRFTVPDVWRKIVKKNERQGSKLFDVLICKHAVPANDNTYRMARSCPECRVNVQRYADELARSRAHRSLAGTGRTGAFGSPQALRGARTPRSRR